MELTEPPDQLIDDERSIRSVVDRWMKASSAGDYETVLGLMTDDVVFEAPGMEPFGKEAFVAKSRGMSNERVEGTSDIVELQINRDWAFLRNRFRLAVTGPDGVVQKKSGYTLTLLRKESDGEWRVMRDANMLTSEA